MRFDEHKLTLIHLNNMTLSVGMYLVVKPLIFDHLHHGHGLIVLAYFRMYPLIKEESILYSYLFIYQFILGPHLMDDIMITLVAGMFYRASVKISPEFPLYQLIIISTMD
eukprot:TRINITY_DN5032_c0_g1_i1.p1 TRINITY_DN5032_c0_g1~~TRINITY_DN5032_c0_g1_i1.p1  ORF type:complete len:110 (-),score=2.58 TRINITY_DN5032_c0_g1_i1:216-545(-)